MGLQLNPLTGQFDILGSGGTPGGSDTQVQFNDGGVFGGDAGLVYNKTTGTLSVSGDVTGTSFIIGANTLNTTEWAFLDGQDQAVKTTSSPTFGNVSVLDEAYGVGWNGSLEVPTKNAVYDKIETIAGGSQTPWTSDIDAAGYTLYGNSTLGGNLTLGTTSHVSKGFYYLSDLTTNGFVKTDTGGKLIIDTSTYLTGNQQITLSGDATGSGTTSIVVTIDHGGLDGLLDDDHTQYALLLGRAGGQTLFGGTGLGDDLTLRTTSHATIGSYIFSDISTNGYAKLGGGAGVLSVQAVPIPIADGGTNSITALNNQRVMTSVGGAIVESGAITDGHGIQRNDTTFISAPLPLGTCEGRLTLTSGTAITTADVSGATTIYFAPYKGDRIYLYDGTRWKLYSFNELSLALGTVTSGLPYDVFIYDNAGTLTLEKVAWTNGTTRATALGATNGVLLKSGDSTRRYLGTFYTTSTTATEDSVTKRFLWNYYNRAERKLFKAFADASHTYDTGTWRAWNASTSERVEVVVGVAEDFVDLMARALIYNAVGSDYGVVGIDVDGTTTNDADMVDVAIAVMQDYHFSISQLKHYPAAGYHFYQVTEYALQDNIITFYGTFSDPAIRRNGILGTVKG